MEHCKNLPLDGAFGISSFTNFKQCKEVVRSFVLDCRNLQGTASFSAVLDGKILFNILCTPGEDEVMFFLSTYAEGRKPFNTSFSDIAYSDGEGKVNWDELAQDIWVEIVGSIDPAKEYSDEQMSEMGI